MVDNNINNLELADDELDNVSGGVNSFNSFKAIGECNCCHKKIYNEQDAVKDKNGKLVCIACRNNIISPII